jgi:hypothetical protein
VARCGRAVVRGVGEGIEPDVAARTSRLTILSWKDERPLLDQALVGARRGACARIGAIL